MLRDHSYVLVAEAHALRQRVARSHQRRVAQLPSSLPPDPTRDLRACEAELSAVLDTLVAEVRRVEAERERVRRALAAFGAPGKARRKASVIPFVGRRRKR